MPIKVIFHLKITRKIIYFSESNINRKPGFRKMKMLKEVVKNITKSDLNEVLIEHGIMSALADWISPLPDKSLPSLTIRSELLKVLRRNFLHVSSETLKLSGIGKAVMLLYKHPKELRENKVSEKHVELNIIQIPSNYAENWLQNGLVQFSDSTTTFHRFREKRVNSGILNSCQNRKRSASKMLLRAKKIKTKKKLTTSDYFSIFFS